MPSISSERVSWNRRASVGELRRVRIGADLGRLEPARPRGDEAARQDVVALALVDRVALAGEQRLVDLEPGRRGHDAVARDLVTGPDLDQVVEHHRFCDDSCASPSRTTRTGRRVLHRQLVELPLGADLLEDADGRVRHQDQAERRVLDRADHEDHREPRRRGSR